jgi:transposase
LRAAEHDRPDVRQKRTAFRTRTRGVDPDRFVFLDEIGAHTALTRLYGRAPCGERLYDAVPQAHWRMTTLVAAVRRTGVVAPLVFEGATDEAAFRTYVERVLVPVLRPGDIVVLDNLAAHRVSWVARRLRQAGAGVWYLPPYSPEYNPIEKIWAKVKAYLRQAKARATDALWQAIGDALGRVTPEDCNHCFAHCGYPATVDCEALLERAR